jgi:hypothetical protein
MTKRGILIVLLGATLLATPFGLADASTGAEEIQVFCYIGDPSDNEYVGTVDLFNPLQATSTCNMVYNDCNMNCIGCYTDQDARQVCVDRSGQAYYD